MAVKTQKPNKNRKWFARIERSRQELEAHKSEWRRNRAMLLGIAPKGVKDWANVNLAWAAFETLVGICFQKVPDALVRHTNEDDINKARMLTAACQQDFDLMRSRYFGRLAIVDVFWAGTGTVIEKMLGDVGLSVSKFSGKDGKVSSYETPALKNRRFVHGRIHPAAQYRDPLATMADGSDSSWEGVEYYPTVKELKEGDYEISKELIDKLPKIKSAPMMNTSMGYAHGARDAGADDDDEFCQVRCLEIWDKVNKKIFYMPLHSDEVILEKEWPVKLYFNGQLRYPWVKLFFNEHPDEAFCIPEISTAAAQIEQFQVLFRDVLKDAVTKFRKYVVLGQAFDDAEVAKLISGPGNQVIRVRGNLVGDPTKTDISKNFVYAIPDVEVKRDQLGILSLVKGLVHEIFGAGDFAAGGMRSTRSATEAAALSDFLKVRMNNRTENIDSFWKELVINHVLYLQQKAKEKRLVEIKLPDGTQKWTEFSKEEIQGEFRYKVIAGSSQPVNTESHRQESLAFFQQAIGPVAQQGGNVAPLIEWAAPLYHMPDEMVQRLFNGHKQALVELADLTAQANLGVEIEPGVFIEAASKAVNTGLTSADLKAVQMGAVQKASQQPVGLPGTNPAVQTV